MNKRIESYVTIGLTLLAAACVVTGAYIGTEVESAASAFRIYILAGTFTFLIGIFLGGMSPENVSKPEKKGEEDDGESGEV